MTEPTPITLSREETLLVTRLLQAKPCLGVEPDPYAAETAAQRERELLHAERSLRARGLAHLDAEGHLLLLRPVAEAVGTCTYPECSVVVHHWTADNTLIQAFGHERPEHIVVHHQPQPAVHQFLPVTTADQMFARLFDICQCHELVAGIGEAIDLAYATLQELRECSLQADAAAVKALLLDHGCAESTATRLGEIFGHPYALSVLHVLHAAEDVGVVGFAWTLVHNEYGAWLMHQRDEQIYHLMPTSTEHLYGTLTAALAEQLA